MFHKATVNMLIYLLVLLLLIVAPLGCSGGQADAPPPNGDPGSVVEDPGNDEPASVPGDNGNGEPGPAQEDKFGVSIGKWSYGAFKPGQNFMYKVTSERGLEGWLTIKVESGENHNLDITIETNWLSGEEIISETAAFEPGMAPSDFVFSLEDALIVNIASSLFKIDLMLPPQVTWEENFRWEEGDRIIEVSGMKSYAGKDGMVVKHQRKSASGEMQKYEYVISFDFPLPLFVESPAANDTFFYEMTAF